MPSMSPIPRLSASATNSSKTAIVPKAGSHQRNNPKYHSHYHVVGKGRKDSTILNQYLDPLNGLIFPIIPSVTHPIPCRIFEGFRTELIDSIRDNIRTSFCQRAEWLSSPIAFTLLKMEYQSQERNIKNLNWRLKRKVLQRMEPLKTIHADRRSILHQTVDDDKPGRLAPMALRGHLI